MKSIVILLALAGALSSEEKMVQPRYTEKGAMLRPTGFREWVFVGSSLGMGYSEGEDSTHPVFHNVYIQPQAYKQFQATGTFPDKTILVMEVLSSGTNASINKTGHFEDRSVAVEAAVKDETRVAEKWAYYGFDAALPDAKAFPKQACWSCHNQHGASDNVFAQFYPVLRDGLAKAARQTATPTAK